MTDHEDSPPNVLPFPGGPCNTATFIDSHGRSIPTTLRNVKRTRPAETYPGEAERMIDTWTALATKAIAKAHDATSGPRLVSALEEAEHAIGEALRWSKP